MRRREAIAQQLKALKLLNAAECPIVDCKDCPAGSDGEGCIGSRAMFLLDAWRERRRAR